MGEVPVFLIFFNRPDTFKMVFEAVKKARPRKLFLACDGPRPGRDDDVSNIEECKRIASDITWDCEVFQNYSKTNLGCGMRMKSGLDWAFEHVDRLVILEDDCVPSLDFFPFAEELLERYKDDVRINMICAMNQLGVYGDVPYSYFYGPGCCWGWATWKRVWETMDYEMSFLNDSYAMRCVENWFPYYRDALRTGETRRSVLDKGGRLSAWTYQAGMNQALHAQTCILPRVNLVTNVGITADSAHAVSNLRLLPRRLQPLFGAKVYQIEWPLKHPRYIIEDRHYWECIQRAHRATFATRVEGILRQLFLGTASDRIRLLKKVFR